MPAQIDTFRGRLSSDKGLIQWAFDTALPKLGRPTNGDGLTTFQFQQRENGKPLLTAEEIRMFLEDELRLLGIQVIAWVSHVAEIDKKSL